MYLQLLGRIPLPTAPIPLGLGMSSPLSFRPCLSLQRSRFRDELVSLTAPPHPCYPIAMGNNHDNRGGHHATSGNVRFQILILTEQNYPWWYARHLTTAGGMNCLFSAQSTSRNP